MQQLVTPGNGWTVANRKRYHKIIALACLNPEQVIEDGADEVVMEEQSRLGVPYQERNDGEPGKLRDRSGIFIKIEKRIEKAE